jgi:L-iditol 2-dehydrogenase
VTFKTPIVVEPYKFTWFDVEFPDPGPYEAIYHIKACLICGSDLHVYKGLHPMVSLPACCGHEVAAEVIEVGSKVTTLNVGDRVFISGRRAISCGECVNCMRGYTTRCENQRMVTSFKVNGQTVARFPSGFGEYTINNVGGAYKIPDNVSYYEAASTTDVAYVTGVVLRSGGGIGDSAAIIGAGPLGLRTLEVAKVAGISPIIVSEPLTYRRNMAKELGADEVINPLEEDAVERMMDLTDGDGVDFVYDTAGNVKATNQGLNMLKTKRGGAGTLYLMGLYEPPHDHLTFNLSALMRKAGRISAEWGVYASARDWPNIVENALNMMSRDQLHILKWITHKIPEKRADEAMMLLIEKRENAIGVEIIH